MAFDNDPVRNSLRAALDLRWRRQELLAHNLANADTPNFRPADLEFEGVLQSVVSKGSSGGPMAAVPHHPAFGSVMAQPGALETSGRPTEVQEVVTRADVGDTLDDNAVDIDKEMAKVADNSLYFQASLELLRRRYESVQRVIADMSRG
jgi:flagellar basal-body rod protein FlgB